MELDLSVYLFSLGLARNVATVVGLLYISWLLFRVVREIVNVFRAFVLAPLGIGRLQLKQYGSWAVVTGASEGIGRGYALELARQGLNVVIMSRSEEKLNKVAEEIKEKYKREVLVIPVDFSQCKDILPTIVDEKLKDLDIGVLVNNVGVMIGVDYFVSYPLEDIRHLFEVNVQSLLQMTRLILPMMVERKKGIIVNLSSVASLWPAPISIPYSSSKALINFFSEGLRKEYESKGILIQTVIPHAVVTAMSKPFLNSSIQAFIMDPIPYTREAVASIGILKFTTGCLRHTIEGYIADLVPGPIFDQQLKQFNEKVRMESIQAKKKE